MHCGFNIPVHDHSNFTKLPHIAIYLPGDLNILVHVHRAVSTDAFSYVIWECCMCTTMSALMGYGILSSCSLVAPPWSVWVILNNGTFVMVYYGHALGWRSMSAIEATLFPRRTRNDTSRQWHKTKYGQRSYCRSCGTGRALSIFYLHVSNKNGTGTGSPAAGFGQAPVTCQTTCQTLVKKLP